MMAELPMKDSKGKTYKGVIHECGSVILHRIPEKPQEGPTGLLPNPRQCGIGRRATTHSSLFLVVIGMCSCQCCQGRDERALSLRILTVILDSNMVL